MRFFCCVFISALSLFPPRPALAVDSAKEKSELSAKQVLAQCRKVANWQLQEFGGEAEGNWVNSVALIGFVELYHSWHDFGYKNAIVELGRRNHWDYIQPPRGNRILEFFRFGGQAPKEKPSNEYRIDLETGQPFFADDHAHGQFAIELYWHLRDPAMINPIRQRIDYVLEHPPSNPLSQELIENRARWNWSDALFMDPPLYARLAALSDDKRYLDFMDREFQASTDYLWSKRFKLIFRDDRFSRGKKISPNGKPIFWGRGNGWFYAGLARILEVYPNDRAARAMYVDYFHKMTASLSALRSDDRLWGPNLLDSSRFKYPDTSASALILYALAWGINQGLIQDKPYRPIVHSSWKALQAYVSEQGEVSGVQPSDFQPRCFDLLNSEAFGAGAYLLACSQIYQLLGGKKVDKRALSEAARLR